jgi:hypothetical protein
MNLESRENRFGRYLVARCISRPTSPRLKYGGAALERKVSKLQNATDVGLAQPPELLPAGYYGSS